MMMKDLFLGLVFLALGVAVIVASQEFPNVGDLSYGAGLFPSLIGAGMAIGGLFLMIGSGRQVIREASENGAANFLPRPGIGWLLPFVPCVAVIAYIYISDTLGALLSMALIMFVLFCLRGVRLLPALIVSAISALVISYAFTNLLSVPLPQGMLGI
jgi:putative tricarboxylic transport membrane protein